MKRLMAIFLGIILVVLGANTAWAINIIPQDGELATIEVPTELTETPDPNAELVGMPNQLVEASFAEWEDGEMDPQAFYAYMSKNQNLDDGEVWLEWSEKSRATYGCTTASISYTNPSSSNIGVILKIVISDAELLNDFGTTFRTDEEVLELASKGVEALENGIHITVAEKLVANNSAFAGMTAEELCVDGSKLPKLLASKGFLEMTEEEISELSVDKLTEMSETERLTIAMLGGYDPNTMYMEIAKSGVIKPGYRLKQIDLHTLPGKVCLPEGTYNAFFMVNGFDAWKSELSDFSIQLPLKLTIKEDLPENLQEEYGVTLAKKIK